MNFSKKIFLLFILLFTKTVAASAPAETEFTVISAQPESAVSWGDFVDIQLSGTPDPGWLDSKNWILRLNGVPLAVGRIYPTGKPGIYRFAIIRPSARPGEAGAIDNLAINALIPERFGSTKAALSLQYSATPLRATGGEAAIVFGLISSTRLVVFGLVALLVVVGIWFTGWKTGVLRDNEPRLPPTERPFSLARVQLALWMVLIGVSFILLYLLTGQSQNVLNTTAVALLGISSVTSLAAAAAGDPKPTSGAAPATIPPTWAAPSPPAATGPLLKHTGLITDIISDANGANLHRVQMAMWTLVLGTIYVFDTWTTLTLPNFDPQTFALMGISSTTYVWFKQKE